MYVKQIKNSIKKSKVEQNSFITPNFSDNLNIKQKKNLTVNKLNSKIEQIEFLQNQCEFEDPVESDSKYIFKHKNGSMRCNYEGKWTNYTYKLCTKEVIIISKKLKKYINRNTETILTNCKLKSRLLYLKN